MSPHVASTTYRPRQGKRLGVLSRDGEPFFLVLEIGSRAVLPKGPGVKKKHVTKLSAMMLTSVPALRGARFRLGSAPYRRSISIGKCRDRAGRRRALEARIHSDPCRTSNGSRAAGTDASSLFPSLASGSGPPWPTGRERERHFSSDNFILLVALFCKRGGRGADGPCPVRCRERFRHRRLPAGDALTGNGMLRFPSQTATQPVKRPIQRELGNHTMSQERTACRLCSTLSNRRF